MFLCSCAFVQNTTSVLSRWVRSLPTLQAWKTKVSKSKFVFPGLQSWSEAKNYTNAEKSAICGAGTPGFPSGLTLGAPGATAPLGNVPGMCGAPMGMMAPGVPMTTMWQPMPQQPMPQQAMPQQAMPQAMPGMAMQAMPQPSMIQMPPSTMPMPTNLPGLQQTAPTAPTAAAPATDSPDLRGQTSGTFFLGPKRNLRIVTS